MPLTNNEIKAPFIIMQFLEGFSVDELWFDKTAPTPLPLRRVRILETLAQAMSRLNRFEFDKIGSLQFESDDVSAPIIVSEFNVPDEAADLEDMNNAVDRGGNFRMIGPFNSSSAYFEALLSMQKTPKDEFTIGLHHLLRMMIRYLPPSIAGNKIEPEVLSSHIPILLSKMCLYLRMVHSSA